MRLINMKKAVSYVEVILVLTLIGVIAVLAVPGLRKHSQKTEMGQLAKKAYFNLEEVLDSSVLDNGPIRNWDFSSDTKFFNTYIIPYIEISKKNSTTSVISVDGIEYTVAECNGSYCHIHVDVNNSGSPNLVGKDFFEFQINRINNGGVYHAESVQPASYGGADQLRKNNWKFTDELWDKKW